MTSDSAHRHRLPRVSRLVLVAALVTALAACGGGDDESGGETSPTEPQDAPSTTSAVDRSSGKTFRNNDFGFTFRYPDDFEQGTVKSSAETAGGEPVAETALALDEDNALFIAKYALNVAVTGANIEDVVPEVDGLVRQLTGQPASGRTGEVGGLPAVRYDNVSLKEPPNGMSRLVFLFDQKTEYLINCQSTPSEREEVERGCDQVLSTLVKT